MTVLYLNRVIYASHGIAIIIINSYIRMGHLLNRSVSELFPELFIIGLDFTDLLKEESGCMTQI